MLQAKNRKGQLVTLFSLSKEQIEHVRKSEQFYCPECKNDLIVRAGPRVIPHFAHRSKTSCSLSNTGESEYHQKGKLLLFHWLKKQNIQANLESYLPEIQQRPDLLFTYHKKTFAIEFQHSTTNQITIRQRNEGYKKLQIIPIWILGSTFLKRLSTNTLQINEWILQFVHQFSPRLPTTLFYLSPDQQSIAIVNDLHLINRRRSLATFTYRRLSKLMFKELFTSNYFSQTELFHLWRREKKKWRLSNQRVFGEELKWRRWLYEHRLHLDYLPSIVHLPTKDQHHFKVPSWNWQSRFVISFLHPLSVGQTFTLSSATKFLQPYMFQKHEYPLLSQVDPPILSYLEILTELKYVKRVNMDTFMKNKDVVFYNHIEKALKGDDELLHHIMYNHT